MSNYDKIKAMSVEEMAEFIHMDGCCNNKLECERSCFDCICDYLKQEAE